MQQVFYRIISLGSFVLLTLSSGAIAQPAPPSTGNLLSATQKAQLANLGIKVIVPQSLPAGFKLAKFQAYKGTNSRREPDSSSYYFITYRGANSTCLEVGSSTQAILITNSQKRSLNTAVGTFEIASGQYRNTTHRQVFATLSPRQSNGGQVIYTGGGSCNAISAQEFDKVLQSARTLTK